MMGVWGIRCPLKEALAGARRVQNRLWASGKEKHRPQESQDSKIMMLVGSIYNDNILAKINSNH